MVEPASLNEYDTYTITGFNIQERVGKYSKGWHNVKLTNIHEIYSDV